MKFTGEFKRNSIVDPKVYDLKSCVSSHIKPRFGYEMIDFNLEPFKVQSVVKSLAAVEHEHNKF